MKTKDQIEQLKEAMAEKVEGEVEKGQPVEIHVQRYDDRPLRKYLTYYGWFRGEHLGFSGEMEKCAKEVEDNEERLIDLQCSPINPDDVVKILPLTVEKEEGEQ
jgi:hypothetical protein